MKVRYTGPRASVCTVCGGKNSYYFGPENNKICDVKERNIAELLRTGRFITVSEAPKEEKPIKEKPPEVEETKKEKSKKKKGRGKKNVK